MEDMNVGMEVVETAAEVIAEEGIEEVVTAGMGFGKKVIIGLTVGGIAVGAVYLANKIIKKKKAKNNIDAACEEVAAEETEVLEAEVE